MATFAAIDIGSNSALLLIAEVGPDGQLSPLVEKRTTLRLSSNLGKSLTLPAETVTQLESILVDYGKLIFKQQVDNSRVAVGATQVFRAATNGEEIAARLSERLGWQVRILSPTEEGRLSYLAAASGLGQITDSRVVIDVGGGSTEIIVGQAEEINWSTSIPLGAVGISAKHGLQQRSTREMVECADNDIEAALRGNLPELPEHTGCLLVGGTASSLAALALGQREFDPNAIHGVQLKTSWVEAQTSELAGQDLAERRVRLCFDPERAEIIVGGCLILKKVLELLRVGSVLVSNRGLRWGLLLEAAGVIEQAD